MSASRTDLATCPGCGGPVRQDEDVLDTWFSSQLVPFSSLGWPDRTAELKRLYPGHVLVTGPDIIFFWVARMVMSGLDCAGGLPFTTVFLTGIVRDPEHQKMSKSRGNGIDPLDVVGLYGADALRYTVLAGAAVGTDLILDPKDIETSFAPGRNFANKLWNVGRFILAHLGGPVRPLAGPFPRAVRPYELTLADRWIIARCEAAVVAATDGYERYRLNDAAAAAYRLLWNDLADWYLEAIKLRLVSEPADADVARAVVAQVFDVALRLLHPVMPFITETLWKRLPDRPAEASISRAPWPRSDPRAADPRAEARFAMVQELIGAIRSIRAEYGVEASHSVRVRLAGAGADLAAGVRELQPVIHRLARVSELSSGPGEPADDADSAHAVLTDGATVSIPLGDLVDRAKECARLKQEHDRLEAALAAQERKLANEQFVTRAPAEVVGREREKLASWRDQAIAVRAKRDRLGCSG
jgi:valyl-tRNA synthetase